MTKQSSWGLFFTLLVLVSSLFFILKTNASEFQGKDIEDIVIENFSNGGEINIMSPLEMGERIGGNYSKEYESTISIDKRKGEIYLEKRGYKCILKVNKVKLLYISPSGNISIYI